MNYSHDNWSAILAHIGKPEELDTSARNAGALTRRREIRDAATLLRLGLAYGPGGMSLREVTAWAQLHDVATLSDVALLKRLRNAAAALNGDYIWDMILIPVSSLILS